MGEVTDKPVAGRAAVRASRRFSAIWIIPVVAIAIGAWLAWNTLSKQGPTITISFESAEGLQAGQSQLKFKDITLGTVQAISLSPDHTHVRVTVGTTAEAGPLLTDTTLFWVVKPRLFAGSLSGLGTLLSGSYIGMLPGQTAGKPKREFVGREDPPVLEAAVPGRIFLLKSRKIGSLSLGSPVFFRDLNVGEVLGWEIGDMAQEVTIHAFVRAPYDHYVHDGTRFWNASGFNVKLGSGGIEVQIESLRAILLGGIAFETPDIEQSSPLSAENHVFPLFASQEAAESASYTRKAPFVSYFSGSVRGLAPGADVTMHGIKVGQVTDVRLTYDPEKDVVLAPVRYEVEPERVIGVGKREYATDTEGVEVLLKHGLRASLDSANLLTGQQVVSLDFVPGAPPVRLVMEGGYIVLPTTSGGGFSGIQAAAGELMAKVNTIPFDQIGQNLNQLTQSLSTMASGPELKETLSSLSATLDSAKVTLHDLQEGVAPAARRLPDIAANLQKTLSGANTLVTSLNSGYGDNTRFNREVEKLLASLDEAARSIRSLADLLTRHPEALVKGRPQGGLE